MLLLILFDPRIEVSVHENILSLITCFEHLISLLLNEIQLLLTRSLPDVIELNEVFRENESVVEDEPDLALWF